MIRRANLDRKCIRRHQQHNAHLRGRERYAPSKPDWSDWRRQKLDTEDGDHRSCGTNHEHAIRWRDEERR